MHERTELRIDRVLAIWLGLGGVVAMGLTFALGMTVGRAQAKAALEAGAPRETADALARLDREDELHDQLTFYSRLTKGSVGGVGEARKTPVDASRPPSDTRKAAASAEPAEARKTLPSEVATPASAPTTAATEPERPGPPPASVSGGLAAGPARSGEFTVQVSSFQTGEEAQAYAAALERKGYKPFVVSASIPGKGTWYRVRLGAFVNEEQAQLAKLQLASSDIPAWVLRSE